MASMHQKLPYHCYIKGCKTKLYEPYRFTYHFEASHPGIALDRSALIEPPETPKKKSRTAPPKKQKSKKRQIDSSDSDTACVGAEQTKVKKRLKPKLKGPSRAVREMAPSPPPPPQPQERSSVWTGVGYGVGYDKEMVAEDVLRAIGKHPNMAPLNAGLLNKVWKKAREEGDCEGLERLMREAGWEGMGEE